MEAVRQALARMDQPAALVVAGEANRRYLSGFRGDAGLLWITADDAALITDSRFWDQAGQECPEWRLVRQRRQPHGMPPLSAARAAASSHLRAAV